MTRIPAWVGVAGPVTGLAVAASVMVIALTASPPPAHLLIIMLAVLLLSTLTALAVTGPSTWKDQP